MVGNRVLEGRTRETEREREREREKQREREGEEIQRDEARAKQCNYERSLILNT